MPRLTLLPAVALLSIAAAAHGQSHSPEEQLARITDGRTPGQPVDCIDLNRVSSTEIVPRTAIVYHMSDGTILVNRPADASFLDRDDVLVTDTPTTRLCNVDVVRLLDSDRMPVGSVGLGMFVPYRRNSK